MHPDLERIKLGDVEGDANDGSVDISLEVFHAELPASTTEQEIRIYHSTKIDPTSTYT